MSVIKKIISKVRKEKFINRAKKISTLLRNTLGERKIGIVDIGAGQRYLPTLLNFDGLSKIAMIDPNKNIDWSYNNFIKLLKFPNNVAKYKFGISNKTKKLNYFTAKQTTGSTFIDIYKKAKKKKIKLNKSYFGKKNKIKVQVYSFKDFVKNFFIINPEVIKIDVEGFETVILKSILKHYYPFLIEIEVNLNHSIYPNTFNEANKILTKKKYKLITATPVYRNINNLNKKNSPFVYGEYQSPILRSQLEQLDCIYVKKNIPKNIRSFVILIGYGLVSEAKLFLKKNSNLFKKNKFYQIKKFIEKF